MNTTVLTFGACKDIIGNQKYQHSMEEGSTVADFKAQLYSKHPELEKLNSLFVAVNEEYAEDDQKLVEGDTIALIPPVSGG